MRNTNLFDSKFVFVFTVQLRTLWLSMTAGVMIVNVDMGDTTIKTVKFQILGNIIYCLNMFYANRCKQILSYLEWNIIKNKLVIGIPVRYRLGITYGAGVISPDWELSQSNCPTFLLKIYYLHIIIGNRLQKLEISVFCQHFGTMINYNNVLINSLLLSGILRKHKWEKAMPIDTGSFTYRRNARLSAFLTMDQLTDVFVETVRYSISDYIILTIFVTINYTRINFMHLVNVQE